MAKMDETSARVKLQSGTSTAVVLPKSGLCVATFSVGGRDVLYPDGMVESGGKPKRRGGIPILFPQAGALQEPQQPFSLPQHGFARDMAWEVVRVGEADGEFRLTDTPETRKQFPHRFDLRAFIAVSPGALDYRLDVTNTGDQPLPAAPGIHPYFALPAGHRSLNSNLSPSGPDADGRPGTPPGFPSNLRVVRGSKFNPASYKINSTEFEPLTRVDLDIHGAEKISMIPGGAFNRPQARLAIWTDRPDLYICFEPWAAGVGALAHPADRVTIPPGMTETFKMRVEYAERVS